MGFIAVGGMLSTRGSVARAPAPRGSAAVARRRPQAAVAADGSKIAAGDVMSDKDGARGRATRRQFNFALGAAALDLYLGILPSTAAVADEELPQVWKGPLTLGYAFRYPESWKATKKQIKTHVSEILVSKDGTSARVGVVVDPVKISTLDEFGTPQEVADRLLSAERKKSGTIRAEVVRTSSNAVDGLGYYTIEYGIENSRGKKQIISRLTINDKTLYVMTAEAKESDYQAVEGELRAILKSFYVKPSFNNL